MPLFGLVYGGVVGAAVTYVAWQSDLLQYLDIWTNGEFSGVLKGRYELLFVAVVIVAVIIAVNATWYHGIGAKARLNRLPEAGPGKMATLFQHHLHHFVTVYRLGHLEPL